MAELNIKRRVTINVHLLQDECDARNAMIQLDNLFTQRAVC